MNIDPKGMVAGVSLVAVRDFLRATNSRSWYTESLAETLKAPLPRARLVVKALVDDGYVEPHEGKIGEWWTTPQGLRLANARATKRYARTTAERHLEAFLARVREANGSLGFAYRVERVLLFGSLLDPKTTSVGDVDVAVKLAGNGSTSDVQRQMNVARIDLALADGRSFGTFLQQVIWPQQEVFRHIKGRSPVISIHPISEVEDSGWNAKVIYDLPV